MTCPCCMPRCCPAYRAFDGTNTFYRYAVIIDWDIPTNSQRNRYQLKAEDGDTAVIWNEATQSEEPVPPGRIVDGHMVIDAADALCNPPFTTFRTQYPIDLLPATTNDPPWPTGVYGNVGAIFYPAAGAGFLLGKDPSPHMPWRLKNILNVGGGFFGGPTRELYERWTPAGGDPGYHAFLLSQIPTNQNSGFSLMRAMLYGEYASPPSPYCYMNSLDNPLP